MKTEYLLMGGFFALATIPPIIARIKETECIHFNDTDVLPEIECRHSEATMSFLLFRHWALLTMCGVDLALVTMAFKGLQQIFNDVTDALKPAQTHVPR